MQTKKKKKATKLLLLNLYFPLRECRCSSGSRNRRGSGGGGGGGGVSRRGSQRVTHVFSKRHINNKTYVKLDALTQVQKSERYCNCVKT
jgi:hypothetical protein